MDIEFENEYESAEAQQRLRTRRIRWAAVASACLIVVIGMVLIITKDSWAYDSSSLSNVESRTFIFTVENLEGNATNTGTIKIRTRPDWAPIGVSRFHNLVVSDFFTGCRFFRVLPNFVAQFGINGDPDIESVWRGKRIADDAVKSSNVRGTLTFATAGPGTRTTQLFFNTVDNSRLDEDGFAPIATVIEGMDVVDRVYSEWREQPNQKRLIAEGNDYLETNFPGLSYIVSAQPTLD